MPTQVINLNDTTPAAPVGMTNVRWQADAPSLDPTVARNVSAYVPPVSGVLHAGTGVPPNSSLGSPAAILQSAFAASRTANFSSAVTAGNLLIVITFGAQNAQPVTISDTVGTHYGSVVWDTSANDDTSADGIVVFAGIAAASGANTVTWSCGTVTVGLSTIGEPSAPMTIVIEVSGAEITISGTFAIVDSTAVTPSTGLASSTSLGLTASQGADFVIAVAKLMTSYGYPVTFTPGATLASIVTINPTSGSDPNRPAVLAAGQVSSAGAIAATIAWTGNTGAGHAMVAAAFKTTSTPIGLGADGDFYLDVSTGILYGPRAGGIWNPTTGGRIVQPDGTSVVVSGAGLITAVLPLVVGFGLNDGSAKTDACLRQLAPRAGAVSTCIVTVTASDASTGLTFRIKKNGVSVCPADPTIASGAAAGSTFTFSLSAPSLSVAKGDIFTIDVISGSATWKLTAQLE